LPVHNTILAILLLVVIILVVLTGRLANPYRTLGEQRSPVELAKDPSTQKPLRDALKWDFAFIPVYTIGLALLCFIAGRAGAHLDLVPFRWTGWVIAVVIAGAFIDVAETIALLKVGSPSSEKIWESIARFGGFGKYLSPFLGSVYSFIVAIWCLLKIASK
jgi:hypothetical protein